MGETILKQIKSGEIELAKDAKGNVIETFKLVGHSQGVAASPGIADVLIENGYKVEAAYNIAPKQPGDIKFNSKVGRVVQYGSKKDIIAPQSPMQGKVTEGRGPKKDGHIEGHKLNNYGNIFEHKNGKDDNVLPRTDVKQNNAYLLSIILLLNLLFGNCVSKKQKLKCLNEIINSNHNDREYIEMKKAIHDSIIHWAMLGLSGHKGYLYNKWKVDDFLFNSKRDKLFGWIINLGEESDKLNFLDFFIGEKLNGRWYYYTHNIAGSIWYDKTKNYNKTYTFKHISNSAKRQFIDGAAASLVAHSQGVAASAGIADVLIENGYKVEASYNIAPKQPGDIKFNSKVGRVVQYGSKKDIIAPQSPMQGKISEGNGPEKDGPIQGHLLSNYGNIFTQPKGSDGYVAPRKDTKENNSYLLSIVLLLNLIFGGCVNRKQQLKCLNNILAHSNQDPEYKLMKKAIRDSVLKFASLKLENHSRYLRTNWRVGDFIMNSSKNKLFGWIIDFTNDEEELNYLKLFIGEKLNGRWYYYTHNMRGVWFDKKTNNMKTYTYKHIADYAKKEIIGGGLFKWNSCTIDDDYIEGWQREKEEGYKMSMYQDHLEFLNSQGMYETDDTDSVSTNSHDKN
ncbi:unnamed protein product [Rotaria socialis]|uniref:Uncharacterized protein n=1 Tax=Rotaria socialis TaxID=392032 RepID=A0A817T5T7_9BILA|nr:unnamed protein product [Rotaria socialis]CAF4560240.1 unnamed protein product [Rotaria socialis]